MQFLDRIMIALADVGSRGALFSQETLSSVATIAYGPDVGNSPGPFSAVFDEVRLGVPVFPSGAVRGAWQPRSGELVDLMLEMQGSTPPRRVDAVWRGAIVVRTGSPNSRIERVRVDLPDLSGIDREIATANGGALPAGAALETARRNALVARLGATVTDTQSIIVGLLRRYEVDPAAPNPISALLAAATASGAPTLAALEITYEAAPPGTPSPRALPVAGAILVRDTGFPLADTLFESALIRNALAPQITARSAPDISAQTPLVMLWIVPAATFDDTAWPGGDRDARRNAAAAWLAEQGVALAAV